MNVKLILSIVLYHLAIHSMNVDGLLHHACQNGTLELAKSALENGANVNSIYYCYHSRNSALNLAVKNGNNEIVKLLLAKGANVNRSFVTRWERDRLADNNEPLYDSALNLAINNDNLEVVKLLVNAKANLEDGVVGKTPLYVAIFRNSDTIVDILLDAKADVDGGVIYEDLVGDATGSTATPLSIAIYKTATSIVKKLIDAKANPNAWFFSKSTYTGYREQSPIELALYSPAINKNDIIAMLLKAGGSLRNPYTVKNFKINFVLPWYLAGSLIKLTLDRFACDIGTLRRARRFAELFGIDPDRGELIIFTLSDNIPGIFKMLTHTVPESNLNYTDNTGKTALIYAALRGDFPIVYIFLKHNVKFGNLDLAKEDTCSVNALGYAQMYKHGQIIELFKQNALIITSLINKASKLPSTLCSLIVKLLYGENSNFIDSDALQADIDSDFFSEIDRKHNTWGEDFEFQDYDDEDRPGGNSSGIGLR